jgi:uncharacterized membrane protein
LPDRLASHFDSLGNANGWMIRPQFFAMYVVLIALAAALVYLPPLFIARASTSIINLPNKEYWLAPERRTDTLAFFAKQFAWFGCIFLLLEISVMQLVVESNSSPTPRFPAGPFLSLVFAFVIFTFVWIIVILRRFYNPD